MASEKPPRQRKKRRWIYSFILLVLLALLLAGGVLLTAPGLPAQGLEILIHRLSGLETSLQGLQFYPKLRLEEACFKETRYPYEERPLLSLKGLAVDLAADPASWISLVHLDELSLTLHGANLQQHNLMYLLPSRESDSSAGDTAAWLPRHLTIDTLNLRLTQSTLDGACLRACTVEGLCVDAAFERLASGTVRMLNTERPARLILQSGPETDTISAIPLAIDSEAHFSKQQVAASIHAEASPLLTLDGAFSLEATETALKAHASAATLVAKAPLLPWINPLIAPFEITAEELRFDTTGFELSTTKDHPPEVRADCSIILPQLIVGHAGTPWLTLAPQLNLHIAGHTARGALTLGETPSVLWELNFNTFDDFLFNATWPVWKREPLAACIPAPWRSWIDTIPGLQEIQGTCRLAYAEGHWEVAFNASPQLGERFRPEVQGAIEGAYPMQPEVSTQASLAIKTEEESLEAEGLFRAAQDYAITLTCSRFSPARWLEAAGIAAAPLPAARLNGACRLNAQPQHASALTIDLSLDGLTTPFGTGEALPSIRLTGAAQLTADFSGLSEARLQIDLGELGGINCDPFRCAFDAFSGGGRFSLRTPLNALGRSIAFPDLWGELTAEGKASYSVSKGLNAAISGSVEDLGYQEWLLPYGMPLTYSFEMQYHPEKGTLNLSPLQLDLGEKTTLTAARAQADTTNAALHAESIRLESDLAPLVKKHWLEKAEGALRLELPTLTVNSEKGLATHGELSLTANLIAFPKNSAHIEGLEAQGAWRWEKGLHGNAPISITSALAGGATFNGINAILQGKGETIQLNDLKTDCFDGQIQGQATLHINQPAFPVQLQIQGENLDLARFCEELNPPSVRMTGKAQGLLRLEADWNGLRALEADLTASEGFTMNRDAVEQILMKQYVGEVSGGKQFDKVMRKIIGEADQRPFDQARIQLGLEEGRIVGQAQLSSDQLNLTVDIKADPQALLEALRARQRQHLKNTPS